MIILSLWKKYIPEIPKLFNAREKWGITRFTKRPQVMIQVEPRHRTQTEDADVDPHRERDY